MFNFLFKHSLALLSNFSDLLDFCLRSPVRRIAAFAHQANQQQQSSWFRRTLALPVHFFQLTFRGIGAITTSPLRLFVLRRRDLFVAAPCLIAIALLGFVVAKNTLFNSDIAGRYRGKAHAAFAAQDYDKAKVYLTRLISDASEPAASDLFALAQTLNKLGEHRRAAAIISDLAPPKKAGFEPAHRLTAIKLAAEIESASADEKPLRLVTLRWHLDRCQKSDSPEVNHAWAVYYLAIQRPLKAVAHLKIAAKTNPDCWLIAGDIFANSKDKLASQQMYQAAQQAFQIAVDKAPQNARWRVSLARCHVKLDQVQLAEEVLLKGKAIVVSKEFNRALAEFYVMRHDRAILEKQAFKTQFWCLQQAMSHEANFLPIYQRLINQYRSSTQGMENIRSLLETAIATGEASALAHFALGNLCWTENDMKNAQFHISQAYQLDPRLAVAGNNLAWVLAHRDPPDLDTARHLIDSVLKQTPNDSRFRDTLATILMKQGNLNEALVEFEKALPELTNKKTVHIKLSKIYAQLGNTQLSTLHRQLAQ